MQAERFDVYDIDGTLTIPGHDLWYLCTRNLCWDKDLFDQLVAEWKADIQNGANPFDRSLAMMESGLALLGNGVGSELIAGEAKRLAGSLIDQGLVSREAINFLKSRVRAGRGAVLSTTNYHLGAVGFLLALQRKGWIGDAELKSIVVSGSTIDWNAKSVVHFNMGPNKVIGLADALKITEAEVKAKIDYAFGDDPLGNDQELLAIAPYPYVIRNEKHHHLNLPGRLKSVTWSDVAAMSVSESMSVAAKSGT